jgi:LPS-assembly lipoprotein
MSSPDRRLTRLGPYLLAALMALALAGCFRPMYSSTSLPPGAPTLTDTLASVAIDKIEGRVGQQVRNELDFRLTGGAGSAPPRYRLAVDVTATRTTSIVDAKDNEPRIDTVTLLGLFSLYPIDAQQPVLTGKLYARKSYDRGLQRFAALRAARDAENGAAKVLADQIRARVAMYLAENP